MKLERSIKRNSQPPFSGRVEIAITGIDVNNKRLGQGFRRSLRVSETTVDEVFNIVAMALARHCDK